MMPSSLSNEALTLAGMVSLVMAVVGIIKLWNWLEVRRKEQIDAAATSAMAKILAVEIKVDGAIRDLGDFKLLVTREYVRNDTVRRIEDRIEQGFSDVRTDLGDLRSALMQALTENRPSARRSAPAA